jgi:hypothetical protein
MLKDIIASFEDEELLTADGFDEAVIGIDTNSMRIIYSTQKCVDILVKQGMDENEATEYFEFNVSGAYMGDRTPIWSYDTF